MKRIAVLGPESTGKSTLCEALASHYGVNWVPEYARGFVEQLGRAYTYDDVETIAQHQCEEFRRAATGTDAMVFFDTELIITKVWMEHCYNKSPLWMAQAIEESRIDFALLCYPDLPWEYDVVRENPHLRHYLYDWYERELQAFNIPYAVITGDGAARVACACQAIDHFFNLPHKGVCGEVTP